MYINIYNIYNIYNLKHTHTYMCVYVLHYTVATVLNHNRLGYDSSLLKCA